MERLIHFLKPNRYGIHVGQTRVFPYGVAELLVQRGIASWVEEPKAQQPATEAVDAVSETKSETPKRRKRSESIEE